MRERLTVEVAARILDVTPRCLRQMMARKQIDIGTVVPGSGKNGKMTYLVYRAKLAAVTGRPSDYRWPEEGEEQ